MKQLEIKTNKRLLIVEYDEKIEIESVLDVNQDFETDTLKEKKFIAVPKNLKFICKGSDLSEEILKPFISSGDRLPMNDRFVLGYLDYHTEAIDDVKIYSCLTALESFISAIQSKNYHWGENPVKEPRMSDYGWYASGHPEEDSGWMYEDGEDKYYESLKLFEESESRTFNPSKCIIFEIL